MNGLQWILDPKYNPNGALENIVTAAVETEQIIRALSVIGLEPVDEGKHDASHVGGSLWAANTELQNAVIKIMAPCLDGLLPDIANDIVERAICDTAEIYIKQKIAPDSDNRIMETFLSYVQDNITENDADTFILAKTAVDALDHKIPDDSPFRGAVINTTAVSIRKHIAEHGTHVTQNSLTDAVLYAMFEAARDHMPDAVHLFDAHKTGDAIRAAFHGHAERIKNMVNVRNYVYCI